MNHAKISTLIIRGVATVILAAIYLLVIGSPIGVDLIGNSAWFKWPAVFAIVAAIGWVFRGIEEARVEPQITPLSPEQPKPARFARVSATRANPRC